MCDDDGRPVQVGDADTGRTRIGQRAQAADERSGWPALFTQNQKGRAVVFEDQEVGLAILVDVERFDGRRYCGHPGERDRFDFAPLRRPERSGSITRYASQLKGFSAGLGAHDIQDLAGPVTVDIDHIHCSGFTG